MMPLIHPQNIDRESIFPGCHAMHPIFLKNIKHASACGQGLTKGKSKEQFLRRVRHFGFELNTARKLDDDDVRFLALNEEHRHTHEEKGKQNHHDDPLLLLLSIARLDLISCH